MAQTVAQLARILQSTGSISAVPLSFALEAMLIGHTGAVYTFDPLEELVSGKVKPFESKRRQR